MASSKENCIVQWKTEGSIINHGSATDWGMPGGFLHNLWRYPICSFFLSCTNSKIITLLTWPDCAAYKSPMHCHIRPLGLLLNLSDPGGPGTSPLSCTCIWTFTFYFLLNKITWKGFGTHLDVIPHQTIKDNTQMPITYSSDTVLSVVKSQVHSCVDNAVYWCWNQLTLWCRSNNAGMMLLSECKLLSVNAVFICVWESI